MKIVCFGNTNNFPLLLVKAFRALGHSAQLIVNEKNILHRPENVDPSLKAGYPSWIRDFSEIPRQDYICGSTTLMPVLRVLETADALILNEIGPSLLGFIPRPAISFLTGSDLSSLANFELLNSLTANWSRDFEGSAANEFYKTRWNAFITRQRKGIIGSTRVSHFPRGLLPDNDQILDSIGVSDEQRIHLFMADSEIGRKPPRQQKRDYVDLLCGARLTWKRPDARLSELDFKGTDQLLRGFAAYTRESDVPSRLTLFEKGHHIEETKALVNELGIAEIVDWLPELSRKEYDTRMLRADVVIDQLDNSVIGMVALDAMQAGIPVMANARPEIWNKHLEEPPPISHAFNADTVCTQLRKLVDGKHRKKLGAASKRYVEKYWTAEANAKLCLEIFRTECS